jgi:hypothetical protein
MLLLLGLRRLRRRRIERDEVDDGRRQLTADDIHPGVDHGDYGHCMGAEDQGERGRAEAAAFGARGIGKHETRRHCGAVDVTSLHAFAKSGILFSRSR